MAMARTSHYHSISRADRRAARHLLALPAALFFGMIVVAVCYIGYVLWPRWPAGPVALDAPTLPVSVAGVTFNIPPAAIRRPVQRKAGVQERIDLAFLWPSLIPPDPATRPLPVSSLQAVDRVFMTISVNENGMQPSERARTIYPRYLDTRIAAGPGGLAMRPFREDTPYQGEDFIYDNVNDGFMVRCTGNGAANTLGMCLYDRRIGNADIVVRFPRGWLDDWVAVANGLDRLVKSLRPAEK